MRQNILNWNCFLECFQAVIALVPLHWKGGVREKSKMEKKPGTFNYLATWQGLRGEDLDLPLDGERTIKCTRTGQIVVFTARVPDDE